MRRAPVILLTAAASLAAAAAASAQNDPGNPAGLARQERGAPPLHSLGSDPANRQTAVPYASGNEALLRNPVSNLFPGGVSTRPDLKNPVGGDPASAQRGMGYFISFNCVGCHAPNGGGGMGRSLSNSFFQYGGAPADIYLSIVQGRPNGMPAWSGLLPDAVVWDLVSYIQQISREPSTGQWGKTISLETMTIEQTPAEFQQTPNPWAYTQKFSFGQNPLGGKGSK